MRERREDEHPGVIESEAIIASSIIVGKGLQLSTSRISTSSGASAGWPQYDVERRRCM